MGLQVRMDRVRPGTPGVAGGGKGRGGNHGAGCEDAVSLRKTGRR
jgi:hypothetical protein